MAVQLQDLENGVLSNTQQSQLVNFGGPPPWANATNPQLNQGIVDYAVNRAYQRLMSDLADIEIYTYQTVFSSTANTINYNFPLNVGDPNMQRVMRVFYQPIGQSWTLEFAPGARLVSWTRFQAYAGDGYLRPFTYDIIPQFASITPNRKTLSFFPGCANAGDTITVQYVPVLTPGTSVPPLVAETDAIVLPDECEEAIIYWATSLCWPKLREFGAMREYQQMYAAEVERLRETLSQRSKGDTQRFVDREESLWNSMPIGGLTYLP
jgi:hypothetical protein